jgi:SSS family solute:Na+ symporter
LAGIENEMVRGQMTVPVVLRCILPTGLMGCVCAMMFCALLSNHDTYLLSWGSVFVQDVILPIRKTPLTTRQHLKYLRLAILGVAVFIYFFSLWFRQTQHIYMFFAVTGAIWLGGAGSVVIGGLYWRRGTTAAAYSSLITGSVLAVSGIVLEKAWPAFNGGDLFPINGQWTWFIAMVSSIAVYVVVSLCGKPTYFDLDRLLHRRELADGLKTGQPTGPKPKGIKALLGINEDFSRRDVFTYSVSLAITTTLATVFIVGTIINEYWNVSSDAWATFWFAFVWVTFVIGTSLSIWIGVGGIRELPTLFKRLALTKSDDKDDGRAEHFAS